MEKKKSFLANYFNKFARKILCNMRISSSGNLTLTHGNNEDQFFLGIVT